MTSPANEMHIFLWQIGTVIPIHKRSVAKTLLQRAESLPSNSDSQTNEREYVLNILGENDYPKRFLNDCLRSPVCRLGTKITPKVIPLLRVMQ